MSYRLELPQQNGRSVFWTGSGFSDWLYEAQVYRTAGAAKNARYQLVRTLRRPNVSDWAKSRAHLTVVEHSSSDPVELLPVALPDPVAELKRERLELLTTEVLPGWIEPYTVTRHNKGSGGLRKDGRPRKVRSSERHYTYHHHVWWEDGSEKRVHLSNRQLPLTKAAIERRRRVEQIDEQLRTWDVT
ncbi:MAG: hypothetical protein HC818_00100 [Synechococcaceae cyanobacterium RM1_1_27]|nr:hypothetical protein [Synechococcaceae cyanobacterium RM1_1_27]